MVDFLELFSLSLTVEMLSARSLSKSAFFEGVGHFERRFQTEGVSPSNHCWRRHSRVIAISCSVKISAVRHLVLSQSTRVVEGQTDMQTDGQNYDSQDRASIAMLDTTAV